MGLLLRAQPDWVRGAVTEPMVPPEGPGSVFLTLRLSGWFMFTSVSSEQPLLSFPLDDISRRVHTPER